MENFVNSCHFFGGVTNVTYHVHGSLVRNRGFQPQIIGDLRADLGDFFGQTYGGASGGLHASYICPLATRWNELVANQSRPLSNEGSQAGPSRHIPRALHRRM